MWLEILEVWQRFFTWTNFRLLYVLLDSSVHFSVKSSFSKNPVSLTENTSQHTHTVNIWSSSISDGVLHLLPFCRWCLITLACFQFDGFSQYFHHLCCFSLSNFSPTDPYLPCTWTRNSRLPTLYLELAPSFSPTVKFIAVVLILTSMVLNKVCFQSLTSAIK